MPVASGDMKVRYSTTAGAAGNANTGTPAGSLGKYISTTDASGSANVFFDDVQSAEASAGEVEYRCIFVLNDHATDSALNVNVQIVSEVASGAVGAAALDNIAASAKGASSAQAAQIANEDTAPSGVGTFGTSALSIGTLTAGQCKGVWLRRTVSASTAAMTGDGFTVRVTFDG